MTSTPFLILTRTAIINWTTLAVFPLEIAFDVIEGELERRWTRSSMENPKCP